MLHYWTDFIDISQPDTLRNDSMTSGKSRRQASFISREPYHVNFLKVDTLNDTTEVNSICSPKTQYALVYCGEKV